MIFVSHDKLRPPAQDGLEGQNELARTLQEVMKGVKKKVENFFSNSISRQIGSGFEMHTGN
jgi:hypothetical protein